MLRSLLASLLSGPPAYVPRTGWPVYAAIPAAVAIFAAAALAGLLFVDVVSPVPARTDAPDLSIGPLRVLAWILAMQLASVMLTFSAAWMFSSRPRDCLALRAPAGGAATFIAAFAFLAVVAAIVSGLAFLIDPGSLVSDLEPFFDMARSPHWPLLVVAIGVGAPLSEELLFRGFLFSALARSRLSIAGAALITSAAWTALHPSYSLLGLAEIFIIGLVLSWLLWRTGSLWVTIFCHAAYNLTIFAGLLIFLDAG